MTLAEIIAEGEQAERAYRDAKPFTSSEIGAGNWCHIFYVEHGPRLLAVAKAGRTLAAAVAGTGSCTEELAAFDAAVRGADEGGNDGKR